MSASFFNNTGGNTLFNKLKGIAENMATFDRFLAVVGFFRSSGYFKLREELGNVKEIKVLVGINLDDIFRKHNKGTLMLHNSEKAKELYTEDFKQDILDAQYAPEIERGILQLCEDLVDGRLEMRIHNQQNLHAKFYLCLPANHNENSDGWVIMGSSNISESGLGITQTPRYELNVAMKNFDDVDYCHNEFKTLWDQSIPITLDDIEKNKQQTYLGYQPTPYELYIKVLIDTFGDQVEDDFTMQLPDGMMELKYQTDAVIQGYQMLMKHNGMFLADVVGLGKTVIATMIAKRFIEANGRHTHVLVVYPPAVEDNWLKTFRMFGISRNTQFITNGSLQKILKGEGNYKEKEEYDLIIVDEAHGFRNDDSGRYDELQKICKAACTGEGLLHLTQKKVLLLSATPLNNKPEDLLNMLLLFQNSRTCTIDGVPDLNDVFRPLTKRYKEVMKHRDEGGSNWKQEVEGIYKSIRERVIDKVTVRRTRNNILNNEDYAADLQRQGIVFPTIKEPQKLEYKLDDETAILFFDTLSKLSDDKDVECLYYARYRAVEFLKPEYRKRYKNAEHIGQTLKGIYRTHMVKRLESSFYAFKRSLHTLLRITEDMIRMFSDDKVLIIPDLKVKELMENGMEIDDIISLAIDKGYDEEEFVYAADCFDPDFLEMLTHDKEVLTTLAELWDKTTTDPKYDTFLHHMQHDFLNTEINPTGKLVLFSESVDTLDYLYEHLTHDLNRTDILRVTAKNRSHVEKAVRENFDANYDEKSDKYNIILTSDVLAEGINLHRSNVIINYDTPWNPIRLMQRIGRVNRIGSVADAIYNYMFYPSKQGDMEIGLYKNSLVKLQGFHFALGEDAQIYSIEEIVENFELFDKNVKDAVDEKIALLREVREIYRTNRELYNKIKHLPMKSRVMRNKAKHTGESVVFINSNVKTEFYWLKDETVTPIDFLEAAKRLKAKPEEEAAPFNNESFHYDHVKQALNAFKTSHVEATDTSSFNKKVGNDRQTNQALNFLRNIMRIDKTLTDNCNTLTAYITDGIYNQLPKAVCQIANRWDKQSKGSDSALYEVQVALTKLVDEYYTKTKQQRHDDTPITEPRIIISESFV